MGVILAIGAMKPAGVKSDLLGPVSVSIPDTRAWRGAGGTAGNAGAHVHARRGISDEVKPIQKVVYGGAIHPQAHGTKWRIIARGGVQVSWNHRDHALGRRPIVEEVAGVGVAEPGSHQVARQILRADVDGVLWRAVVDPLDVSVMLVDGGNGADVGH